MLASGGVDDRAAIGIARWYPRVTQTFGRWSLGVSPRLWQQAGSPR